MKPLNAPELLQVWEESLHQPLLEKSLRLLSKACPTEEAGEMAQLSVGERDARLLQLREWLFGPTLRNLSSCPKCAEAVEWESSTTSIRLQTINTGIKNYQLEKDEYTIQFRLPNSVDMSKIISGTITTPQNLMAECILDLKKQGQPFLKSDLPHGVWEELSERMEVEDPQADIRMQMNCPTCAFQWDARFDIMSYFWEEIGNWARRILQEVSLLASAFGWSESEILLMSPHRRQLYIEMIRS